MSRLFTAILIAAALCGCSSSPAPSTGSIDVVYRFENVRSQPGFDEWTAIRTVLEKHTPPPVVGEPSGARSFGDVQIRDYRVPFTVSTFAALDEINADLAELASIKINAPDAPGQRVEFSLADVAVRYRGSYIAAGLAVTVNGVSNAGFVVSLFLREGSEPVVVTADRRGMWSTRIGVIPEARWIYGSSEDPAGKVKTKYFRINVNTLKQETISEEEFLASRPKPASP